MSGASATKRLLLGLVAGAVVVGASTGLTGCGNFFVCAKASCTSSGSSTTTNYAYVSNSASGTTYVNGYALASGALVAATGSPYSLNYTPSAMVVNESNGFLYVGSNTTLTNGTASLYVYPIGTGGALGTGSLLFTAQVAALAVSADGKWLFVLNTNDGVTLTTISEYAINTSTGALTQQQSVSYSGSTTGILTPDAIKLAPSGNYIAVAAGTAGVVVFPFTTSTGVIGTSGSLISFSSSSVGANDLGIDGNNFLYLATTSGLLVFSVSSAGAPSAGSISSVTTGVNALTSLAVDGTSFIYAGNFASNTLYGFSTTSAGTVASLSPTSVSGPASLSRVAVDSSGKYLVALGFAATGGLEMYTISSTGALTLTSPTLATGTSGAAAVMALTH